MSAETKADRLLAMLEHDHEDILFPVTDADSTTNTVNLGDTGLGRMGWFSYPPDAVIAVGTDVSHHEVAPCDLYIWGVQVICKTAPSSTAQWNVRSSVFTGPGYGAFDTGIFEIGPSVAAGALFGGTNATLMKQYFRKNDRFALDVVSAGGATGVQVVLLWKPLE